MPCTHPSPCHLRTLEVGFPQEPCTTYDVQLHKSNKLRQTRAECTYLAVAYTRVTKWITYKNSAESCLAFWWVNYRVTWKCATQVLQNKWYKVDGLCQKQNESGECNASSFTTDWLDTEWTSRIQSCLLCYRLAWNRIKGEKATHPPLLRLAGNRMKVEKMQRFLLCYRLAGNKVKVENAMPPPLLQIA